MNDKTDLAEALRTHEPEPRVLKEAMQARSDVKPYTQGERPTSKLFSFSPKGERS